MLSFCSQSHVKENRFVFPRLSCPWMCLMDIVCSLKCSLWEDHAEVMVCIACLWCSPFLSHSQICIFNRIPKLLQCRRLPLIFVNILNPCFWVSPFLSKRHGYGRNYEQPNKFFLLKFSAEKLPFSPTLGMTAGVAGSLSVPHQWTGFQGMDLYFSEFRVKKNKDIVWRESIQLSQCFERENTSIEACTHPLLFYHRAQTCLCDDMVMSSLYCCEAKHPPPPSRRI